MRGVRLLVLTLVGLTASCDNCFFSGESLLVTVDERERCTVRGLVDILNDTPRAGLRVEAITDADSVQAVTNALGDFTFARQILCEGVARLVDVPPDLWFPRSSTGFAFTNPPVFDGYAGAVVTGRATWNGRPLPGIAMEATATVGPPTAQVARGTSAGDGSFRLEPLLFDQVVVGAVGGPPGLDPNGWRLCRVEGSSCNARPVLELPSDADRALFELRFEAASVLRGVVTIEGEPAPGLALGVEGPWSAEILSGADGTWEIPNLPAGDYTVTLSGYDPSEVQFPTAVQEGVLEGGGSAQVDFHGTRVQPNTAPVVTILSPASGSTVGPQVTLEGTGVDAEDGVLAGSSLRWTSDRDGLLGTGSPLEAGPLSAGAHRITLTAVDSGSRSGSDTVSVEVVSVGRVEGRVALFGQEPVSSVPIGIVGNGLAREASTGLDGRYVFPNLPPGTYQVSVAAPAGTSAVQGSFTVTLLGGDVAVVDFDLRPVGEG